MSYDIQVWSVRAIDGSFRRLPEEWDEHNGSCPLKSWQLIVTASDKVLPEDVPAEVTSLLAGVGYVTHLNLEGKTTEQSFKILHSTAKEIARLTHGAILDPQEGSVRLPSSVKRYVRPARVETFELLVLSWWFLDGPLLTASGREAFIALLDRLLPEALPKRYGLYEPPQYLYSETGKSHLLRFLDENLHDTVPW